MGSSTLEKLPKKLTEIFKAQLDTLVKFEKRKCVDALGYKKNGILWTTPVLVFTFNVLYKLMNVIWSLLILQIAVSKMCRSQNIFYKICDLAK